MADLLQETQVYLDRVNEGVWMTVLHPATRSPWGEAEGRVACIRLLGLDSDILKKVQRDLENRTLMQMQKGGQKSGGAITSAHMRERQLDLIVAATVDWKNIDWQGTSDVPCSPLKAREIYSNPKMDWLRRDVDNFIASPINFGGDETEEAVSLDDSVAYLESIEKKLSTGASGDSASSGAQ